MIPKLEKKYCKIHKENDEPHCSICVDARATNNIVDQANKREAAIVEELIQLKIKAYNARIEPLETPIICKRIDNLLKEIEGGK